MGAWGAAQATAAGLSIVLGGALRDTVGHLADSGGFGPVLTDPTFGYTFVYHIEIGLLFADPDRTGAAGRASPCSHRNPNPTSRFGLVEFPT